MNALAALLLLMPLFVRLPVVFSSGEELDGSKIFVDSSCHDCHSVDSRNIEKKALPKIQGGDLSTIGEKRKKPDWMRSYLKGKKRGTNGLEHNVTPWIMPDGNRVIAKGLPNTVFAGTDAELETLAIWLVNLKKGASGDGSSRDHIESISLEGQDWSLLLDLPGFAVDDRQVAPSGSARMIRASNRETGLMISIFLERDPAPGLRSMSDCRDYHWEKGFKAYPFPISDVKRASTENMALVEWFVNDGDSRMKHVNAYMYRDGVCVDIHLSKSRYETRDDTLFTSVLSSIRYSIE